METTQHRRRNAALDAVKFLAAVFIVCHHYQQMTGVRFSDFPDFYGGSFYVGYLVELFFVISGYLMFVYVDRIRQGLGFVPFMVRRVSRLLPLVAVASTAYILLDHFAWYPTFGQYLNYAPSTYYGGVLDALGIQAGWASPNPCVNNPTWYVSVLLLCYVVFWLVTDFARRKGFSMRQAYTFMVLVGAVELTLSAKFSFELPFLNMMSARGYMAFFTGVLLAMWMQVHRASRYGSVKSAFVLLVGVLYVLCYYGPYRDFLMQFALVFTTYPALIFLLESEGVQRLIKGKVWTVLGGASYDVYIWHVCILIIAQVVACRGVISMDLAEPVTMLAVTLVVEAFGLLSYLLVEKRVSALTERGLKYLTE